MTRQSLRERKISFATDIAIAWPWFWAIPSNLLDAIEVVTILCLTAFGLNQIFRGLKHIIRAASP